MFKNHPGFNFIFLLIFVVQLASQSDTVTEMFLFSGIHYISKPLITISLLFWLIYHTSLKGRFAKAIAIGLIAGLFGDVFLMFTDYHSNFFLAGLFSFLVGHLFYARAFFLDYSLNKLVYPGHKKNAIIAYSFFVVIFLALLIQHVGNLLVPILIYGLAISVMGVLAVCRFGRVNSQSYQPVFIGSVLFVISDAVLAYNKFVTPIYIAKFVIIGTYMAAQYLIIYGSMQRKIKRRIEDI